MSKHSKGRKVGSRFSLGHRIPGAAAPSESSVCHQCDAVFADGRWAWADPPPQAREIQCPACRLIHDQFPAGFVHVSGNYYLRHRNALMQLIEAESAKEQSEHPLERIIGSTQENSVLVISTTGTHLARRLGEALHHSYQGELSFHYSEAEDLVRVYWHR